MTRYGNSSSLAFHDPAQPQAHPTPAGQRPVARDDGPDPDLTNRLVGPLSVEIVGKRKGA